MTIIADINCMCCHNAAFANYENMTAKQLIEVMWHCEYCWDKYHNGERDKDWLDKDEYMKVHLQ